MLERTENADTSNGSLVFPTGRTRKPRHIGSPTTPKSSSLSKADTELSKADTKRIISDSDEPEQPIDCPPLSPSTHIVLPNESESDWNQLLADWQQEYNFQSKIGRSLVYNVAVADWFLRRALSRYNQAEQALYEEQSQSHQWASKHLSMLNGFLRQRTAAEQSFYKARQAVEQARGRNVTYKEQSQNDKSSIVATPPKGKLAASVVELTPEPAKQRTPGAIIQCVTVQIIDGKTFTLFQPRNEYLIRMIEGAGEPRPAVKRAIYFLHGIPDEYSWITSYDTHDSASHFVIERTCEEALRDLAHEQSVKSRHILPAR